MYRRTNCKVSIVTVSYNAVDTIEETIQSVLSQNYQTVEYIVIDGGSTDGTVDIIKRYSDKLSYWVSEPDSGIYYAMNKGINVATGEWINFMNAGDRFVNEHTISDVFGNSIASDTMVIYGDVIAEYPNHQVYEEARSLFKLKFYMPFCHQSCFVRLSPKLYFDTSFRISADFKLMRDCLVRYGRSSFKYIGFAISVFEAEKGISSTQVKKANAENLQISKNYFNLFWWYFLVRNFLIR